MLLEMTPTLLSFYFGIVKGLRYGLETVQESFDWVSNLKVQNLSLILVQKKQPKSALNQDQVQKSPSPKWLDSLPPKFSQIKVKCTA